MIKIIDIKTLFSEQSKLSLFQEYANESKIAEAPEANPNEAMYNDMEARGFLTVVGLYSNDLLAGFTIITYSPMTHNGEWLATLDSIFIHQDYRKFGSGKRLIEFSESVASKVGAKVIVMTAPVGSRLSKVAKLFSYKETNIIYSKAL